MTKSSFDKRKRKWARFEKWELQQIPPKNPRKALHLVGEWVDFFLLRHPRRSERPNVRGIQKMHQSLSHLSFKK